MEVLEPRLLMSGTVDGAVFDDANQNGLFDVGEQGLADWRVYLDNNVNGQFDFDEPYVMSDTTGAYQLTNVMAGTHRLAIELPNDWEQTDPDDGFHTIELVDGETLLFVDFGMEYTGGQSNQSGSADLISGPAMGYEADVYTLTLDDDGNSVVGWQLDWGDGTTQRIIGNLTHITHEYDDGDETYSLRTMAGRTWTKRA